ncbi:maestro heat-like repeat-containing protein family member 6 isoform X2 [Anas acuta]|uniref:maestro heat-like repeat-containing protein family member 6 isoform X2 n=1 Tax=Anas acuta TaxID=28680 RepID=UPI0035C9276A
MDVERILRFLHENLKRSDSTSLLRQSFFLVLKALTNQFPREALLSVLTNLPPLDSTTLDMWKVMLSFPMTSEKILEELQNVLEDKRVCRSLQAQPVHTSLLKFAMMHPTEHVLSNLRDPKKLLTLLSLNSLPILWLVLRALVMLSETSQMVTDVQVLLPEVMETLQYENTHINMKALTIFKNVIRHLEKKEASPIALTLAGRLLPLFNDVSSEVRECSMLLFKDLMESVLWWKKGEMKKTVHRAIIPLLFRMSDNTESVAKVSAVILLACAKFLKWKQLEQLAQTEDIWKIGEYLLKQKRSRVEGYLQQSLPYLWDDQTSLRQMAVKFVVLRMQCDTHPSIRILAAGTIEILQRQVQQQPASRWARLKALRCWP